MANKIFELIPKIMAEVGGIEKNRKNTIQNYSFRGIDDVYLALQPLFAKYGVFVAPNVVSETREERQTKQGGNLIYSCLKIQFSFFADDGSFVIVTTIGEGMDSSDKASNKAMSAAFKAAMLQVFCIPTEEPKDSENESHEVKPKTKDGPGKPTVIIKSSEPLDFVNAPGGPLTTEPKNDVSALLDAAKKFKWKKESIRDFSERKYKQIPSALMPENFGELVKTVSATSFPDAMAKLIMSEGDIP